MAIPRTGQLGAAALGSLWLAAPVIWSVAYPTGRVHAMDASAAASAVTAAPGAVSALGSASPSSTLSARGAASTIGIAGPEGSVE